MSNQICETPCMIRHVPTRARSSDQILQYAIEKNITNEMLIKVGLRMNGNLLFGSNQRCVAMLTVYKSFVDQINSELCSIQAPFAKLQDYLKSALNFLDFCRPISVSMSNSSELLNQEIIKQASADSLIEVQSQRSVQLTSKRLSQLKDFIDTFIDEEIWSAQRGICENIDSNITSNDVILIYGCSTIVQHVLLNSKSKGKRFRVIVVDSAPHFNGRRMLNFLNDNEVDVTYTLINSLSFVMRQATKVLLGANSILANGYVMSHIGTSQVALIAKALNVPTLICCETYKLSDRVYVDSFVCNEMDNRKGLTSAALNLRYDLTPPEFVSMVINERSIVPAISVPALLRFRAEKTKTTTAIKDT